MQGPRSREEKIGAVAEPPRRSQGELRRVVVRKRGLPDLKGCPLRAAAGGAAGRALEARPVAHQGEVAAFVAGIAFVAFHARLADLLQLGVHLLGNVRIDDNGSFSGAAVGETHAVAGDRLKPIIIAGLYTGGRVTELLTLGRTDIDLAGGVLTFDQTNTKSSKQREIPICDELEPMLRELLARPASITGHLFTYCGRPMLRFGRAFATARRKARLGRDVTPHTLRHTFASWFRLRGGDLFDLMELMGHSNINLTKRYAHVSPEWKKARRQFIGRPSIPGRQDVDKFGRSSKTVIPQTVDSNSAVGLN